MFLYQPVTKESKPVRDLQFICQGHWPKPTLIVEYSGIGILGIDGNHLYFLEGPILPPILE